MKRNYQWWMVVGLLSIVPVMGWASPIFVSGRLDGDRLVAAKETTGTWHSVRHCAPTAQVDGDTATVRTVATVAGPTAPTPTVCLVPLPATVVGTNATLAIVGADGRTTLIPTRWLDVTAAQQVYEGLATGSGRVEVLAWSGRPALLAPAVSLAGKTEVVVEFRQQVRVEAGVCSLGWPDAGGRLTAEFTLATAAPLRAVFSPTHEVTVQRDGLRRAVVRAKSGAGPGAAELRLFWVADADDLGLRVLASRPERDEDGYFLLLGNPTGSATPESVLPKEVVFVLDTSGSMRGEKLEQARAAIEYCLGQLAADDTFNVVAFGTKVTPFRPAPVAAAPAMVQAAREFVDNLIAEGETNISGALVAAMVGQPAAGRSRLVFFLTDGVPTAGELVPGKILEAVQRANTSGAQVFVFGVGHDVNAHLLDKLAEQTHGSSEYVTPQEEIDAKVATLYDRLAHPVLADVQLDCGALATSAVYPKRLPALFRGSEVLVFGRYREGGRHTFTLRGQQAGQARSYICTADLPAGPGDGRADFVAPLWAARAIGFLLQEIRLRGRNDELIAEVVRLSRRYGIVTEYTEFLAAGRGGALTEAAALGKARAQMEVAHDMEAGAWAVNQSLNDRALQTRVNASAAANTYRDRQGRVVSVETIRPLGRRAFYLRDRQWVDAEPPGARPTRKVEVNSEAYRALVRQSREFAEAQQLGWAVTMNVGAERIVVEKNGQAQDDELKKLAVPEPAEEMPEVQQQQQFRDMNRQKLEQFSRNQQPLIDRVGRSRLPAANTRPLTAAGIRAAVDDAVLCLRRCQQPDGSVAGGGAPADGLTALATLAVLAAGGDPKADDQLAKTLDWLGKQEPNNTYVRALRANVWEYALRKMPYDQRLRDGLKADAEWLLKALGDRPAWRYTMESRDWDNSCTQYGVLGLWAAARAGFDPGEKLWRTMAKHFQGCQNADGAWGYTAGGGSTPNMATAGLASLFLVFDTFHARAVYRADAKPSADAAEGARLLRNIERGMDWLGKSNGNKDDGYYLYGIERTGVASGRKTIGGEDWFARGAKSVLAAQRRDGSIPMGQWGGPLGGTAFCTLFLVYGGAPVAINKLEHGTGQDWNRNPRDLANLSKHLWSAYERPINWQTVPLAADVAEWEAPILFISGAEAIAFTDAELAKLRAYIRRGGTLFAEPSDHSPAARRSLEELPAKLFPPADYPGWQLAPLPADHGIFTVLKQEWQPRPKLRGVSDGSRTCFILSDEYLSANWQAGRTDSAAFQLATSLLFYASDLGELPGRFASILPDTPAAAPRPAPCRIARVQHTSPRDWDAANQCWTKFAPYLTHVIGHTLAEAAPVRLGTDKLDGLHLLHLTGREPLRLTDAERQALKDYVAGGGTVLVDAYAGAPAFAASARRELAEIFGPLAPLSAGQLLAEGRFVGGADLNSGIALKLPARQLLRQRNEAPHGQKLLVAHAGRRPAVIYSEFDLSAAMAGIENYRALGYKPDSARRIVSNLLAYIMAD